MTSRPENGDLVVVDVHLEIDGDLSVKVGHDIAVLARKSVLDNHHVLNVMTHVDPYFKEEVTLITEV